MLVKPSDITNSTALVRPSDLKLDMLTPIEFRIQKYLELKEDTAAIRTKLYHAEWLLCTRPHHKMPWPRINVCIKNELCDRLGCILAHPIPENKESEIRQVQCDLNIDSDGESIELADSDCELEEELTPEKWVKLTIPLHAYNLDLDLDVDE